MPASEEGMHKVNKTLLRSILRWTKKPYVKYAPFKIDLTNISPKQSTLLQLREQLPADLEVLNDAAGVRAATLYCFRTGSMLDTHTDNEVLDVLFGAVKYLNGRSVVS